MIWGISNKQVNCFWKIKLFITFSWRHRLVGGVREQIRSHDRDLVRKIRSALLFIALNSPRFFFYLQFLPLKGRDWIPIQSATVFVSSGPIFLRRHSSFFIYFFYIRKTCHCSYPDPSLAAGKFNHPFWALWKAISW